MFKLIKLLVSCIFIFAILGTLATCDDPNNPFSNNLGKKVVVEPPTISVTFPTSGDFIRDKVTITGKAKAYISVEKVEVHVLANPMYGQPEIPWTEALPWRDTDGTLKRSKIKLGGSLKEKTWSLDFDTTKFNGGEDGFIQMEFRVHDTTAVANSIKYTFVIKNNPSSIIMANPSETEILDPGIEISRINWGGEIRGQVIDLKGIRPGYPQIQVWPHDDTTFPFNENDPDSFQTDSQYGWGSLFLTGDGLDEIDQPDPNLADGQLGKYVDRMNMRVLTTASFSFKLAEWYIAPDATNTDLRPIRYKPDSGKFKLLNAGKKYNFRIRTKDTPSDATKGAVPCDPDPSDPQPFLEGFFPPLNFGGIPTNDPVNHFVYRGDVSNGGDPLNGPVRILIFSSDSRPTIELNNDDLVGDPRFKDENGNLITAINGTTNANSVLGLLKNMPNIYISGPTSRKIDREIDTAGSTATDFRLRLLIAQPNGLKNVILSCLNESSGKSFTLDPWVGVDVDPSDLSKGKYYYFFANGSTYSTNSANTTSGSLIVPNKSGTSEQMFTTSSAPYTITVTVVADDNSETKQRYTVYMDGEGPAVSISSVRGAFEDAKKDGIAEYTGYKGGMVNKSPYTVNGNIQVAVARTDNSGIMAYKSDMGRDPPVLGDERYTYPMVKWFVEYATESEPAPAATGTIMQKLITFRNNPTPANLEFFNKITDERPPTDADLSSGREAGWVRQPLPPADRKPGVDEDKAHHFKFNTSGEFNGKYLWLYVIAQDQVQNLGFFVQKIYVDDETDKPVLNIPTLFEYNASDTPSGGTPIAGPADLDVNVVNKDNDATWTGNYSKNRPRRNVLGSDEGIQLNLTDDDGVNLKDGVKIILTELTGNTSVTLSEAQVRKALGNAAKDVYRDISGSLSQNIMAQALYNTTDSKARLRDGMYRLEITVTDAVSEKVEITPYRIPGDTPVAASTSKTYYFAVFTDLPKIEIINPAENDWGSDIPITVHGTARSRLDVRKMWITFTPDVTLTSPAPHSSMTDTLDLVPAVPPVEDGFYIYTWKYKDDIKFQPDYTFSSGARSFTVEACDRLGNISNLQRTLQTDVDPPDVTLIEFNYDRPYEAAQYLYGKVSFMVSASDANGLYEKDGYSGIKWWVLPTSAVDPTWDTAFNTMGFEMGGNFPLNQEKNGRYTGIIDTRKLTDYASPGSAIEYKFCIIARDRAGNTSCYKVTSLSGVTPITTTNAYEIFRVDQSKDLPDIDENSLDSKDNVKDGKEVISGTVSDADLFNFANRNTPNTDGNTYVQIRFAATTDSNGLPATWTDWIRINIPHPYSSGRGGIDPSGSIVFKFDVFSKVTGTDNYVYTGVAADAVRAYLSKDGIKYYQLKVTDEAAAPSDADKAGGAKNYGKNPDLFMVGNPLYPGYVYTEAKAVSKTFPSDTDGYRFIVDATFPEIFFDKYDPTKETKRPDDTLITHPNHTSIRPTYSKYEDLINDLSGKVEEYKLSTFSLSWSVGSTTKTRTILNNPPDQVPAGEYKWDLKTTLLGDADLKQFFIDAPQGLQIIVFEATDLVAKTSRVSWNFSKDTQGPDIFFYNIARAIAHGAIPNTANFPNDSTPPSATQGPLWPSDWPDKRHTNVATDATWKSWDLAWQTFITTWPSEYAFVKAADAQTIIDKLQAEKARSPSTVIGDATTAPDIKGYFSDQYSSVRKILPVGNPDPTYFYYRFLDKQNNPLLIPPENTLELVTDPDGCIWLKKLIEDPRENQNERAADWVITLDKANGFGGPDGENRFDIRIEDTAGNMSEIFRIRFLVDRSPPVLGKDPNDPGTTDADEFEVISVFGTTSPLIPGVLKENERVFSATWFTTNDATEAFKLQGTVSDATLKNLQITIGQEGSAAYTVVAAVGIDIDSAGAWTYTNPVDQVNGNDDTLAQKRLTLVEVPNSTPPQWTWTLTVQKRDIYELRTAMPSNSARRYIRVSASDKANKRVGPVDWFFYLDNKQPDIEYTNLEKATASADGSSFENNVGLSVLVTDETKIKDVRYMIGRWDYGDDKWKWYDNAAQTWTLASPPDVTTDISRWPSAFTSDTRSTTMNVTINQATLNAAADNTFFENSPAKKLFEQEGKYRLDLYVTDFSLGLGNPRYTFSPIDDFKGDMSGRVFLIDKKDPRLEWEDIADKTYFRNENGQVVFKFIAGDGNTIKSWEAVVSDPDRPNDDKLGTSAGVIWKNGSTAVSSTAIPVPVTVLPTVPIPAGDNTINNKTSIEDRHFEIRPFMTTNATSTGTALDLDSTINPGGLPKTYTITITVWDGAKRSNSITKSFNLDNKPPDFIQDKFNPASYKFGTLAKAADPENGRVYSYEAVTGRLNIRGNSEDNSNQIKRVAFYVPPTGPGFSGNFPNPDTINDATSTTDGWHWHDPAYPDSFAIKSGGSTIMQIEEGTFAWRIIVPQTSLFLSDSTAKNYVQITRTGGIPELNNSPVGRGSYRDVTFTYNPSTKVTTADTSSENVPDLTFSGLNNTKTPDNPKQIYGNEEVGLITVYVLVEDMAGNITYDVLKYWVWPAGDRPQVISINNPDSTKTQAERLLNGTIRLSGMAKDNEQVKNVWFRVLGKDGDFTKPYDLNIPEWDADWVAIPGSKQTPRNDADWSIGSRKDDDPPPSGGPIGGGWYKANGGDAKDVSWWAYINTQGELDPVGLEANEIRIEVRAQDVTWDDANNTWKAYTQYGYNGFASTPLTVHAWVVSNAPLFESPPMVASGPSKAYPPDYPSDPTWTSIDNASIRNRSSYKVTVKHTTGLSAIRWSPTSWSTTLNSGAGGFQANPLADAYNLLNPDADGKYVYFAGNTATVGTQSAVFKLLADATATGTGSTNPRMAVTVNPMNTKTGSGAVTGQTITQGKKYMIWNWTTPSRDHALVASGVFTPNSDDEDPTSAATPRALRANLRNRVFTAGAGGSTVNIGDAVIIEAVTEGSGSSAVDYFKWEVVVDVRADLLMSDLPASYGPPNPGQTKNSVYYPVYLSASEVSKSTPLTTRGDAQLPIDNLKPYAMYTLNRKAAGQAATIGGEAGDDGPVAGVAKVVLWFSRMDNGTRKFISWHEQVQSDVTTLPAGTFVEAPASGPGWWDDDGVIAAWNAANPTKPQVKKPYIPAIDIAGAATGVGASAIVIDRNSPSVGQDAYGHKLPMGFANGGMGKYWYVEINTYGILSGPVTLHYVVIDKAGNAKYYSEPLIIMNNAPAISQIKLATDIRDNSDFRTKWTNATLNRVGKGPTATPTEAPAAGNEILEYIRNRVPLGTTDVEKGITEYIYPNDLTINKVIDFNVRNKLLAVRIETVSAPGSGKTRNFRLEYVSGAVLKSDTGATGQKLTDMKAGRVYIINNPGTARWGAIGAEGDGPWPRGYAFIAAVDGTNEDGDPRINGVGSAWELNSAYYNTGTRTLPANLNLGDVSYTAGTPNNDAVSAEFVYNSNAFGTTAGSTIIDYTNTTDAYPPEEGTSPVAAGNSMFILRVFDGGEEDQFGDFAIIRIRVNNDDKTKPFAQLYDLNPMTEGVDRAQSRQRSLTPMFIGEGGSNSNRLKGGLWNTDAQNRSISKPGHIEPRSMTTDYGIGDKDTGNLYLATLTGESAARNHSLSSAQMGGAPTKAAATVQKPWADPAGYFATDTVSGQVVLRGYVEDNERIEQVDLLIGSSTIPILTYYNNAAQNTTPGATGYGQTGSSSSYTPPRTGLLQIGPNSATTPTADAAGNPRVYFTDTIDLYRHRVEWAYVWDTEAIPANTVVNSNVNVRVRASNRNSVATNANKQSDNTPAPGTAHVNTSEATRPYTSPNNPGFPVGLNKYNSIPMNIRPFITGFKRDASKFFHNNRSMQGWTAFARGEEVVVEGFNLGRDGLTTNISFPDAANMTAAAVNAAQQTNFGLASTAANRYRFFTILSNSNAKPGTVTLTTGTFPAVNTSTNELAAGTTRVIQPWNIEYSPAINGSKLWDDTRSVHIWQSNNTQTGNDRASFRSTNMNWYIMSPSMSIDPRDGTLHASHNEGGSVTQNSGSTYISANNSDTLTRVAAFIDPILFSDIYFSTGGAQNNNGASQWSAFSIIGRYGTYQTWTDLGGVYIYGPNGGNPRLANGISNNNAYVAESTFYNASTNSPGKVATPPSTDQFMNPHIVTYAIGQQNEHIHVSYYDAKDGSIKYRYNRRGSPGTVDATTASYGWTNLDGGVDEDDQQQLNATAPFDQGVAANGRIVNYDNSLAGTITKRGNIDAGEHNSIAVTSNGYPYVAYFDKTKQKLKLAVSNSTTPYAAANWKIIENVIPTNNASFTGTGQFVSMKIDTKSSNKVHIAALNSINKQLVYISGYVNFNSGTNAATFTGTSGGTDAPVVQVVDSVGMVGRWCALSLDVDGNPWISYQDESNIGSMDGVKMAFLNTTRFKKAANDIYGASVSGWETMHVPAQYRVENPIDSGREHGRLGMECFPTRNYTTSNTKFWTGAVSYRAPDLYRIAYYIKP